MLHLPTEVIYQIIFYLGVTDRSTCLRICRRWHNLFQSLLYDHVILRSQASFHQFLDTLTLSPVHGLCVHELAISDSVTASSAHFDILTQACPNTRSLDFRYECWQALNQREFERWRHIARLPVINDQRVLPWLQDHPTLQHLELGAKCFGAAAGIVARAPSLRHLALRSCPSSNLRGDVISLSAKPLKLAPILNATPGRLESLKLMGTIRVTDSAVHFPPLMELSMRAVLFEGTPYFDMTRMQTFNAHNVTSVADDEFQTAQRPCRNAVAVPPPRLQSLSIDRKSIDYLKPILVHMDARHIRKLSVSVGAARRFRRNRPAQQVSTHPKNTDYTAYSVAHTLVSNHDATPALQFIGCNLTWIELMGATIRFRELVSDKRLHHLRHLILSRGRIILDTDIDKAAVSQQPFRRLASIKLHSMTIPDLESVAQWTHRLVVEDCTCHVDQGVGITLAHHWLASIDISKLSFCYELYGESHSMDECRVFGIIDNKNSRSSSTASNNFYHACGPNSAPVPRVWRIPDTQATLISTADSECRTHLWRSNPFIQLEQARGQVFQEICSHASCGRHFGYIAVQRNNPRLECRFEGKPIDSPRP